LTIKFKRGLQKYIGSRSVLLIEASRASRGARRNILVNPDWAKIDARLMYLSKHTSTVNTL
jgi:hypothetical protein